MYVRERRIRRPMAIKGANTPSKPILPGRPTPQDINWKGKVIKGGVQLWTIGTDTAKHVLYRRLAADGETEPSGRFSHFSEDLEDDYFEQLVSEAFDPEKNRWVKRRGRRNEGLDTWVYAFAAAHHPEVRIHRMRSRDWDELERHASGKSGQPVDQVETPEAPPATPAPVPRPKAIVQPRRGGFVNKW